MKGGIGSGFLIDHESFRGAKNRSSRAETMYPRNLANGCCGEIKDPVVAASHFEIGRGEFSAPRKLKSWYSRHGRGREMGRASFDSASARDEILA